MPFLTTSKVSLFSENLLYGQSLPWYSLITSHMEGTTNWARSGIKTHIQLPHSLGSDKAGMHTHACMRTPNVLRSNGVHYSKNYFNITFF